MALFWEFFSFELKFRLKSISTYVYFGLWVFLSFLSIAAEDFLNVGNDKVLLNGPFSTTILQILLTLFGIIVIAAIFGTSILRDFQRDTYQIIFTKPITKFAYLGGRWAGSFVITVLCFSGLIFGEAAGTLAPWADHTRIVSGHFWWYVQPFLSITLIQIFFLGSLFFCVAGLTRKLFIVYLQGVVVFMAYLIANAVFQATRSLEHFWSAIFDPAGLRLFDSITRYWTVVEKNRLLLSWNGVFLYNRLIWTGVGLLSLVTVYMLFPLSVEALTAVSQGRRAAKARASDSAEDRPARSLVAARLPSTHQVFGPGTTFAQFVSLTQLRISNILHELPFWSILAVMVVFAIISGHFAGRVNETNVYTVTFPQVLIFALLALFLQTMLSNKFIAHGLVIGIFVLNIVLFNFGWENTLYLFGNTPPYTYSDMNGYGHFVPGLFWSLTYWLSIAALLGIISVVFALRGPEDSWRSRLRLARQRAPRFVPAAVVLLLISIGSGSWYFYNTHVLNEYLNAKARRDIQADYERNFKKYEGISQPKIIAVDAAIDILPERRAFSGTGHFVLQNKTAVSISQIHVVNSQQSISNVRFDRSFHVVSSSPRALYTIYALDQPMAPGEKMNMNFNVGYATHGFKDGNERPELAYSGTFFDVGYFPSIGYDAGEELVDPRRRRDEHLGPVSELPHRGDPVGSVTSLFTQDSDWISYRTVVSTADDQIALAPGYPQREWHQNGRHYYEYNMGDVKTLDFYAYVSARYDVKRDTYPGTDGNINIEVYSAPAHPYDVDDMIAASKAGLGYYEKNFSPFQYGQFRILEFPRYRAFAQSFPNTVPYAEFGFITRVAKPDDIDFTYFVTAHELAHQWWGHQLIGGRVEGSNMMSESLAEYSALRVMQKKYGDDQMHKFLKHELDGYLRGRSGESHRETPLDLVQREGYVWYQKGSLVLYALSDYIGEDKLNLALHNFLMQYRYANATDSRSGPYPDTRQFVEALRAQTPPELQYYITDAFESIVLYDNKALTATVTSTMDKKYKVVLSVQSRKLKSDGIGNESPMPLNDYIDLGVFTGSKDHEKPLYLKKEKITKEMQTFEIVVDQMPTRAGIDPYNKLIDRIPEDNVTDVSKR